MERRPRNIHISGQRQQDRQAAALLIAVPVVVQRISAKEDAGLCTGKPLGSLPDPRGHKTRNGRGIFQRIGRAGLADILQAGRPPAEQVSVLPALLQNEAHPPQGQRHVSSGTDII